MVNYTTVWGRKTCTFSYNLWYDTMILVFEWLGYEFSAESHHLHSFQH